MPPRLLPIIVGLLVLALPCRLAQAAPRRAPCSPSLAAQLEATGSAAELVTVVAADTASTTGTLSLWRRDGSCWKLSAGPWQAWLGRNGVSADHHEGDGTTPEGSYGIGPVIYGGAPNPGVHYRYQRLDCGDWWDEDPSSPSYNRFVHLGCGERPAFGGGSEALWLSPTAYAYFALVDYNTSPVVPGAGSAIFVHVSLRRPTNGCVALPAGELVELLRWLRPRLAPRIVIGTAAGIRRL